MVRSRPVPATAVLRGTALLVVGPLVVGPLLAGLWVAGPLAAQVLPTGKEIQACLERARPALLTHLKDARGDVLALVCLAAVHDGIDRSDDRLRQAARRLQATVLTGTYGAALRLMVLADDPEFYGPISAEDLEKRVDTDVKNILRNRIRGGFTYRKRGDVPDLSNTQYAALGLRAAVSLGASIPEQVWLDMLTSTLQAQEEATGGFGYTRDRRRRNPYASMTVAGIAVLHICRQNLPAAVIAEHKVDQAIEMGWRWMDNRRDRIGRFDTLSCLYFHYGLERAAVLSDVTRVDGLDWYLVGARMLLEMQHEKNGSWRSSWEIRPGGLAGPGSPVDTAFAVLFLRRKFQKVLPPRYPRLDNLGVQATRAEIEAAAGRAVAQGDAAIPQVIKALRSPMHPRRAAAAIALRSLSGRHFDIDPEKSPDRSATAIKAAELWWLRRRTGR